MKPVRVYFVCSFLRGLYCLKVCSFQLMENRRVSILKLMGMWSCTYPRKSCSLFIYNTNRSFTCKRSACDKKL
ncbi:hypothetical protein FM050_26505 [Bacillus thuringiensis]|nr:hypothetical protein FM050_26505 [Bacillus thuringiensis]